MNQRVLINLAKTLTEQQIVEALWLDGDLGGKLIQNQINLVQQPIICLLQVVLGVLDQVHSSLRVFFPKRRQRINKLLFYLSCAFRASADNLLELLVDMVLRLIQFLLKLDIVD